MKGAISGRTQKRQKTIGEAAVYKLSHAKTYLGRLLEQVVAGQTVYIMRGPQRFVLQQVHEIEPIPIRPPGYFASAYSKAEAEAENELGKASVVEAPEDLE